MKLTKMQAEAIAREVLDKAPKVKKYELTETDKEDIKIYIAALSVIPNKLKEIMYMKTSVDDFKHAIVHMNTPKDKVKSYAQIVSEVVLVSIEAESVSEIIKKVKP